MNCKSNPSAVSCKECMGNAPYNYCCRDECGEHEFCRGCERYIGECKPVTHGHWETYEYQDSYGNILTHDRCSNCKSSIPYNRWGQYYFSSYCPECGAKMDESEE